MASVEAHFTRAAYNRMHQELEALKEQRAEIRNDIKEAREQGDLRENFAYHAAKDAQGMLEARIVNIEARLANAVVVEEGAALEAVVLGVPVTVRRADTGDSRIYIIVSSEEMDSIENGASEESPVGSALLGKKVGDVAEVQGPRGPVHFEIVSIG